MIDPARRLLLDPILATLAVASIGIGSVALLVGIGTSNSVLVVGGAGIAFLSLIVLLAAEWISPLNLLVFSLPLPALFSTDAARLAPSLVATAALLFAWLFARSAHQRPIRIDAIPRAPIAALISAIMFASLFANSRAVAVREIVNWLLLCGLLIAAVDLLIAAPKGIRQIAVLLSVVGAMAGVAACLEAVGLIPGRFPRTNTPFFRAAGGFGWPNELGMFFALVLPFAVFWWRTARGAPIKSLAAIAIIGTVVGLAATFSRGSWLAVIAAPVVLIFMGDRAFVFRFWLASVVVILLLDVAWGGAIRDRIVSTAGDSIVEQRLGLTLAGIYMFLAHPLVGVGPGGFGDALQTSGTNVVWLWDYTGSAQNGYVHIAAEAGAIGLIALLSFIIVVFGKLYCSALEAKQSEGLSSNDRQLRNTVLWSFASACLVGFVEWQFAHGVGELIMLVIAMGLALTAVPASST